MHSGKSKGILCMVMIAACLIVMAFLVEAQEEQVIKIILKQAEGNKIVKDVLVNIVILEKQSGNERTISSFIRSNPIKLALPKGEYLLTFKIDNLKTPGKDFYAEQEITLEKPFEQEVVVFPVGSLKGVVLDKLNNLVSKAALKIECSKDYGGQLPETTDLVGVFSMDYAPIGECTITATSRNAAGRGKATIVFGATSNIEVRLDRAVVSEESNGWIIAIALILVLAVLGGGGWYGLKLWKKQYLGKAVSKMLPEKHVEHTAHAYEKVSKRIQDVTNTLNEKEKRIVTFLLSNNHQSTQAKIRYETGIPKTTLVRVFTSLQNKKVISIETIGKLKKIKLTNWFLDKEN